MNVKRSMKIAAVLVLAFVGVAGAQQPQGRGTPPPPSKFKLMTAAYADGGAIPTSFSCVDPNAGTPALQWSDAPAGTMSFALIFHDLDAAPMKGSMDVTHWISWNISGTATSLPANIKPETSTDVLTQGKNVRGANGLLAPCPPPGATPHHYIFELYALDAKLDLAAGSSRADLLKAMDGHVVGKASYTGNFGR